jgi:dephospho-CoA kinase
LVRFARTAGEKVRAPIERRGRRRFELERGVDVRTIGLTGGIGSGKSTVAEILTELGAFVVDADRVGHEVYLPGTPGWDRVVEAFGRGVIAADGTIDRKALGAIVFADPEQLLRLNAIVHPLIGQAVRDRVAAARSENPGRPVVVEAALLVEAKWYELVDEVWVVEVAPEVVIERVTASRPMDVAAVQARIDAQLSNRDRRRVADVVISNDGTPAELRAEVERLWRERIQSS